MLVDVLLTAAVSLATPRATYLQDMGGPVTFDWPFPARSTDDRLGLVLGDAAIRATCESGGSVWAATDRGLAMVDGDRVRWSEASADGLLSSDCRDVAADRAGMVWIATDRGVSVTDGHGHWLRLTGAEGLPVEDVRCIALGPNGDRWFGTWRGVCRLREGEFSYFAGRRWLPSDDVLDLAVDRNGAAWVRTPSGVGQIASKPMTLEEKAERFLTRLRQRHIRHGLSVECRFESENDLTRYRLDASDNDGLWTALYVAAESFRYAVTRADDARRNARDSMMALVKLEEITGIRGFPARSMIRPGEDVNQSGGEWHPSPDGQWIWKGDTSSDELDGHYFAYAIYYDLVADEEGRRILRETIARITDHLLDHEYSLIDLDGQPTRWAVFGPQALNDSPQWAVERGLNSLSMLSHLNVAYHLTRNERYRRAHDELVREHGYALNAVTQKVLIPGEVNHSDDELAFLCYYPALLYERDPDVRALLLASIERSWRIEQPERNPFFNFVYGAVTGKPCDVEAAERTLREYPMEIRDWRMENSHRADIMVDPRSGRFDETQSTRVLPYSERCFLKWNGNPYRLDSGGDGLSEDDGAAFLLPYWMGRYYGFVTE